MAQMLEKAAAQYATEASKYSRASSTREETYYPTLRDLLAAVLASRELPFDVRMITSERRAGGGTDSPDVAFYDGAGDYLAVCGEVKLPSTDIKDVAMSVDRENQVGRYLAQTRAVLVSN